MAGAGVPAQGQEHEVLHHPFLPRFRLLLLGWAPEELVVSFVVTQQFYEGP